MSGLLQTGHDVQPNDSQAQDLSVALQITPRQFTLHGQDLHELSPTLQHASGILSVSFLSQISYIIIALTAIDPDAKTLKPPYAN